MKLEPRQQSLRTGCPLCRDSRGAAAPRPDGEADRPARRGDPLMCLNCTTMLIIDGEPGELTRKDEDGTPMARLREMTDEEVGMMDDDIRIAMIRLRRHLQEERPMQVSCPICEAMLVEASHMFGENRPHGPQPGDVAQCGYCSAPLIFTGYKTVRLMTRHEWADLPVRIKTRITENLVRHLREVMTDCVDSLQS